ncbi:hypothetical protein [Spiroplasma endosymbiont of Zeiraphera isertana]|uniref:hypothetical protein n=1 Tax=Spiroplasma endosymbiont of Zeiraphera isertana TaxID=3066313 RepID=UPI00313B2140
MKHQIQDEKNANKYKEPNNPDLQTRINQILENCPNAKEESINENINIIINYLKVEEKIYNAEKNFNFQKNSWWNKKNHQPGLKFYFI